MKKALLTSNNTSIKQANKRKYIKGGAANYDFDIDINTEYNNIIKIIAKNKVDNSKKSNIIYITKDSTDKKLEKNDFNFLNNKELTIITANLTDTNYYSMKAQTDISNDFFNQITRFDTIIFVKLSNDKKYVFLKVENMINNDAINSFDTYINSKDSKDSKDNISNYNDTEIQKFKSLGLDINLVNKFVVGVRGYINGKNGEIKQIIEAKYPKINQNYKIDNEFQCNNDKLCFFHAVYGAMNNEVPESDEAVKELIINEDKEYFEAYLENQDKKGANIDDINLFADKINKCIYIYIQYTNNDKYDTIENPMIFGKSVSTICNNIIYLILDIGNFNKKYTTDSGDITIDEAMINNLNIGKFDAIKSNIGNLFKKFKFLKKKQVQEGGKKINTNKILNNLILKLSKINNDKKPTKPKATKATKPTEPMPSKPKASKPTEPKPSKPKASKPTKSKATKPTEPKPSKQKASKPTKSKATKPTEPKPSKQKASKPTEPKPSKPKATKPTKPKPTKTKSHKA